MTAEEIAMTLANVFRQAGDSYPAEPEVVFGGRYPLVVVWDDTNEATLVIACSSSRHDPYAGEFAKAEAAAMARLEENTTCPYRGYVAYPAATDPTAIVIEEFIWNGD